MGIKVRSTVQRRIVAATTFLSPSFFDNPDRSDSSDTKGFCTYYTCGPYRICIRVHSCVWPVHDPVRIAASKTVRSKNTPTFQFNERSRNTNAKSEVDRILNYNWYFEDLFQNRIRPSKTYLSRGRIIIQYCARASERGRFAICIRPVNLSRIEDHCDDICQTKNWNVFRWLVPNAICIST